MNTERPWTIFGQVLKKLRIARKLSQAKLGQQCGLDQTYISLMERGLRQPTLPVLYELCDALGLTFNELITELECEWHRRNT